MGAFTTTRRGEFGDTDMAGIAHFSNFFRWMEAAECDLLRSVGLSVKMSWEGRTIGFPRVAAACDYLKPARFQDLLEVVAAVERIGTKSVTYGFEFRRGGEVLARGKVTSACCAVLGENEFQAMEIPPEYRAKIERYQT